MFHIGDKAVAGQKIPHERICGGDRALDDGPAAQAHKVHVVGVVGQVVGRRAVVEMGMGDQAHLLESLEIAIDGREGKGRPAVSTHCRGQAVRRGVAERSDRGDDPFPLWGQPHALCPQGFAKVPHTGEPTRRSREPHP